LFYLELILAHSDGATWDLVKKIQLPYIPLVGWQIDTRTTGTPLVVTNVIVNIDTKAIQIVLVGEEVVVGQIFLTEKEWEVSDQAEFEDDEDFQETLKSLRT